jgi:hypothetical protein
MLGGGKDAKTLMPGPSRFGLFGSAQALPSSLPATMVENGIMSERSLLPMPPPEVRL